MLADGTIDMPALQVLTGRAKELNLSVTFFRSFDLVNDRKKALAECKECGVDTILTAGSHGWNIPAIEERLAILEGDIK